MKRFGSLAEASRQYGEPLETLVPRLLEQTGSIHAAAVELGVFPNSLRYWMQKNGVKLSVKRIPVVTIEKDTP